MDFKCVEFVEELMYGAFRKTAADPVGGDPMGVRYRRIGVNWRQRWSRSLRRGSFRRLVSRRSPPAQRRLARRRRPLRHEPWTVTRICRASTTSPH